MRWLDSMTESMDMSVSKPQEMVKDRETGVLQTQYWVTTAKYLGSNLCSCQTPGDT